MDIISSEQLLQEIHAKSPGLSYHFLKNAMVYPGVSSYDLLVEELLNNKMLNILDLGCNSTNFLITSPQPWHWRHYQIHQLDERQWFSFLLKVLGY